MLIRFIVNNVLSFGKQQEFSMLANNRANRFPNHCSSFEDLKILKLSSIYGANGSGKSNFIKALDLLRNIIKSGEVSSTFSKTRSRSLLNESESHSIQEFFIEFIADDVPYGYLLEIRGERIAQEKLCHSGLGKNEDTLIFNRTTFESGITKIEFGNESQFSAQTRLLKKVVEENLIRPNKSLLKTLTEIKHSKLFPKAKSVLNWFINDFHVIYPLSIPSGITLMLQKDQEFKTFVSEIIKDLGLGIAKIDIEEIPLEEFLQEGHELPNLKGFLGSLTDNKARLIGARTEAGAEVVIIKRGEKFWVKRIRLFHESEEIESGLPFVMSEESDGTIRLFNLLPAFFNVIYRKSVFIIDEIERSVHPVLIKELLRWVSRQPQIGGQIIFTTHESNLLDQNLFRQDEIWFTEKDPNGNTSLYSLSDFKEHHTLDIRKGYLSGRYGAIPFVGELDL